MPPALSALIYADEKQCVNALLESLPWDDARRMRVQRAAETTIEKIRSAKRKLGELESFLREYGLDTEEGLALMTLAEALLRIPDAPTAHALIRDKMKAAAWLSSQGESQDLLMKAAGLGLSLTRMTLDSALGKLGEPVIRKALVEALGIMGRQFVLGRSIEEGLKNAGAYHKKGYRLSYDMLGEGARTREDAERYFESYRHALEEIGKVPAAAEKMRDGLSVKLSALHPRYSAAQESDCVPALTEKLRVLAVLAARSNTPLTVDAEEVDRLALSLAIIGNTMEDPALSGWEGFGLAVQAYQKRCPAVVEWCAEQAQARGRRMQVRLVKGAYWDAEIKRAQVMGLPDYPVFTRKENTDLSYIAGAARLLAHRDRLYPMLATHNAHTVCAVLDLAGGDRSGFEFQRLHGMGETLHDLVLAEHGITVAIYAPCGTHQDLLPYLVRRLLENGANSSFVNRLLDPRVPAADAAADPVTDARNHPSRRHGRIALPAHIYGGRTAAAGLDLAEESHRLPLARAMREEKAAEAAPLIDGKAVKTGAAFDVLNPADHGQVAGKVWNADDAAIEKAFAVSRTGFSRWSRAQAGERAAALERAADLLEKNRAELMMLCVREAGKTLDDAQAEIREAVDFCRYYAQEGRKVFADAGEKMPGPTGERNILTLHGRGVFVCISPWNFPLAIFMGQVAAALMAGNAVIAKPAEQTPLVAFRATQILHEAGIPASALQLVTGDGAAGAKLVAHKDVAGVTFTGSTEVARLINRALAAKDGPIVPLIAETGGQNAMIVDSSALTEQVVDDVITSAFGSTGQRCSALRVLYVQEEIADKTIAMLRGALALRRVGDPFDYATDTGPVIDETALRTLEAHAQEMTRAGKLIAAAPLSDDMKHKGYFFAPVAYEIGSIRLLAREVFGPVLHVIRYKSADLDKVLDDINGTGYGLTFGLHTRLSSTMGRVAEATQAGNVYINRTMIGAVVGVQPFGGQGLSGTGPKAGGPHYLPRFATEKVVSTDTTRQGGNAALVSLRE